MRGELGRVTYWLADLEELEAMDASEIYSDKLNAKEVIFSQRKWRIYFSNRRLTYVFSIYVFKRCSINICLRAYTYIFTHTYMYIFTSIYMHRHMCVCMCVCSFLPLRAVAVAVAGCCGCCVLWLFVVEEGGVKPNHVTTGSLRSGPQDC